MASPPEVGSLPLTHGARRVAERALEHQRKRHHDRLGVNHWLLALLERHGPMAEALADGLEATLVRRQIRRALDEGDAGDALDLKHAVKAAAKASGRQDASERHLASAILAAAGYRINEAPSYDAGIISQGTTGATPAGAPTGATPTLDEFGRDLTRAAREGKIPRIVGREDEIREVCRTLCRRTKRNPALIGPAGTGKTAIVEGLAQRVVAGEVPEPLKGIRIIELQASALVAGAGVVGTLENRMKDLLKEAAQEGVVLFIDELHAIMGSGGMVGRSDVGAQLKPALGRGDISCIGATTDDEFRRFVESDKAMERRFRPIAVEEMRPEDTMLVLEAHRDLLSELRGVEVPDEVLRWLLDFGEDFLRNRAFPDKAVDLLEQCVATAVMEGESKVDVSTAQGVAQEMVGMPIDLGERVVSLGERLLEASLLDAEAADELLDRVSITMRGLDLRPTRPNAVVLLADRAADVSEELAETIADTLLGDPNRVVELDFGQYDKAEDVNQLLGAPPAYIGFGEHLPLHDLARMPWSVVVLKNVDGCHPQVREVLAQALADGFVTERSGKRVYLSDSVVVMTAPSEGAGKLSPGFLSEEGTSSLEKVLGERLLEQIDVTSTKLLAPTEETAGWIERSLLAGLADQYREEGLTLAWAPSFVDWVREQQQRHPSRSLLTRTIERLLGEVLIPHLPEPGERREVEVETQDGEVRVAETARRRKEKKKVKS